MKIKILKRLISSLVILGLILPVFGADVPKPFDKIKELALKVPANQDGEHILWLVKYSNGDRIIYVLIYSTKFNYIGIGTNNKGNVEMIFYLESFQEFKIAQDDIIKSVPAEDIDKIIKKATKWFKEFLGNG